MLNFNEKLNPKIIRGEKGALRTDGEDLSGDDLGVGEDKKAGLSKQTEEDIAYNEIRHWSHDQKVKRFALYIILSDSTLPPRFDNEGKEICVSIRWRAL